MKILVINNGSSTIKYQLFDTEQDASLAGGLLERIGEAQSRLEHTAAGRAPLVETAPVPAHRQGMLRIAALLTDPAHGVIRDTSEIHAVGHRVVHGGEAFRDAVIIDDSVLSVIRDF